MVVVGCAVMPHGPLILQSDKVASDAGAEVAKLHAASLQIADEIRQRKPHLIVLCTPHGVTLDSGVHTVYTNKWAKGTAEFNGAGKQYDMIPRFAMECEIDTVSAQEIVQAMKRESIHVAGVEMFGGGDNPAHLGWAEIVPMWFLDEVLSSCKMVFLSMANAAGIEDGTHRARGQGQAELANVSEYIKMGQVLSKWMSGESNSKKRIYVIASAGLSHGYGDCNPIEQVPGSPGSSIPAEFFHGENDRHAQSLLTDENMEASALYDQAVELWVTSGQAEVLLLSARKAVALAQPCGYSATVFLHGVLDGQDVSHWKRSLHARCCPSNFGMIAATFHPRWNALPHVITDTTMASLRIDMDGTSIPCWFLSPSMVNDIPFADIVIVTKRPKIEPPPPEPAQEIAPPEPRPVTESTKDEESDASEDEEDEKFFETSIEEHRVRTAERKRRAQQGDAEAAPPPPPPWTEEFSELSAQIRDNIVAVHLADAAEDELETIAALAASYGATALIVTPDGLPAPPPLPVSRSSKAPAWSRLAVVLVHKEHWDSAEVSNGSQASIDWFMHPPSSHPTDENRRRKSAGKELGLASIRKEIDNARTNAAAVLAEEVHELQQKLAESEARNHRLEQELHALKKEAKPSASAFAEALYSTCRYRKEEEMDADKAKAELFVIGFVKSHTSHYQPETGDLSVEAARLSAMLLQAYARRKILRLVYLEAALRSRRFNGILPDALASSSLFKHRSNPHKALIASPFNSPNATTQPPRFEFQSGVASFASPRSLPKISKASMPLVSPGRSGGFLAASTGPRGSPHNLIRSLPKETELEANLGRYDFLSTSGAGGNLTKGRILPFAAHRSQA